MFREIILHIFRSTRLCVTVCGIMHRRCSRPVPNFKKGAWFQEIYVKQDKLFFYILLTVHLSIILDNDQLNTKLLYFTIRLLWSSTCFEHYVLIIMRLNCIDAASGIVTLSKWPSGVQFERELSSLSTCAPDGHLLRVTIPDAASIQFNLLIMSILLLETCRGLNKRIVK